MAACNAGWASVSAVNKSMSCFDTTMSRSEIAKHYREDAGLSFSRVWDATLEGTAALIMEAVAVLAELINKAAAIFLSSMAFILDAAIDKTIKGGTYELEVVDIGWTAVRDFSNMFFIFALLYIAILTILGLAGSNTKRWVAHLIIGAILINFSLFATKVVIDTGNVLAVGFWEQLKSDQGGTEVNSAAAHFMQGFKIQTVYSSEDQNANDGAGEALKLNDSSRTIINLGGAILMFIAGYLFLAGAVMMIVRTVTLILLMIFSPFAFLGFSLPKGGGFAHTWLNKLIGSTFVAPAFIFMLYLNALIINALDLTKLANADTSAYSAAFLGHANNFEIILNFVTLTILLLSSMTVANAVSSGAGTQAGSWSKKLLGYGGGLAVGAAGIAGGRILRQTAGATGSVIAKNKKIDEYARSKNWMVRNVANVAKKSGDAMAKSTWDVRNTGLVKGVNTGLGVAGTGIALQGVGSASKKSYATHGGVAGSALAAGGTAALRKMGVDIDQEKFGYKGTAREEEYIKIAKDRFKGNPEAQKAYLQDRGVQLDEKRNKDEIKKLNQEISETKAKETIKNAEQKDKEISTLEKKVEELRTGGASQAEVREAEEALTKAVEEMTGAFRSVGSKYVTEMTLDASPDGVKNRALLTSSAFAKYGTQEQLKAIAGREDVDHNFLSQVRDNSLSQGSKSTKDYLVRQMRNEDSRFYVDHGTALKNDLGGYKQNFDAQQQNLAQYDTIMEGGSALTDAQQAEYTQIKDHKKSIGARLGYMTPEQVANVDTGILLQTATTQNMTPAMLQEMIKQEKASSKFGVDFFKTMGDKITNDPYADPATKRFVDRARTTKDSPFNTSNP